MIRYRLTRKDDLEVHELRRTYCNENTHGIRNYDLPTTSISSSPSSSKENMKHMQFIAIWNNEGKERLSQNDPNWLEGLQHDNLKEYGATEAVNRLADRQNRTHSSPLNHLAHRGRNLHFCIKTQTTRSKSAFNKKM
eukprot:1147090-Pelagomonas_calceolata.AAC.1